MMVSFEMDGKLAAEMDAAAARSRMTRSAWLREAVREHLDRHAEAPVAPAVDVIHAVVRVGDSPCPWDAAG